MKVKNAPFHHEEKIPVGTGVKRNAYAGYPVNGTENYFVQNEA
jgi:hypothetical protein